MAKLNIQDEIRRITNETAAAASAKALEVAEAAKAKAAEVAAVAMADALKAATLAATKAAEAVTTAAAIAGSTSKDLEYIKSDIASTKLDIKSISDKLDNKYVTKEELKTLEDKVKSIADNLSRAVWIVLTTVILAVLSVVIINYK